MSTRRPPTRRSRRPTASSRASTTRTRTRATRPPRSASRRSRRPTASCPTPRSAASTTRAVASSAAPGASTPARSGPARAFPAGSATSSPTSSAVAPAARRRGPQRRARPRSRDRGHHLLRPGDGGRAGAGHRRDVGRLSDLPRHRRQARHHAAGVQPLQRPRRGGGVAGPVLDLPAVPPVRRHRHRDHRSLHDLRRRGLHPPDQALQGEHPCRRARRQPRPPRRQGRGRAGAAGRRATCTWSRASPSRRLFKRKGDNLEVEIPVTIPEAIRGATIEVPTLNGSKRIRVSPGTQHGTVQRLRGEGPPRLGGKGRGDIHYRLAIDVPRSLSEGAARGGGRAGHGDRREPARAAAQGALAMPDGHRAAST